MKPETRYAYLAPDFSLAELLPMWQGLSPDVDGWAFAYGPDRAEVLEVSRAGIAGPEGPRSDWGHAFEVRLFNRRQELRWVRTPEASGGRASVQSEVPVLCPWPVQEATVETLPRPLLLWGQASAASRGGWVPLFDARIGRWWVPLNGVSKDQRLALGAIEYVEYLAPYDNARVTGTRLTDLRVWAEHTEGVDDA